MMPSLGHNSRNLRRLVAIVGRPNVGKSRLFNRLVGESRSIVDDTPGVTRDRILGRVSSTHGDFLLCDTGGFEPYEGDSIKQSLVRQAEFAISEAAVVMLVVDVRAGIHPVDKDLMRMIRRSGRQVLVIVNKCDTEMQLAGSHEFRQLGTERLITISAEHNLGFDVLIPAIEEALNPATAESDTDDRKPPRLKELPDNLVRLAIIGRPNVGKSSILNALVGEERSIVDERPGTTRDYVDVFINAFGKSFQILDTAGIRRKSRVGDRFETWSIVRAIGQLEECQLAILVVDAKEGPTEGDARVAGYAFEKKIPLIICVNKWDLIEDKNSNTMSKMRETVLDGLRYISYAPVQFCSAKENFRVNRLLELASSVHDESSKRVSTSVVNQTLKDILEKHTPPLTKSRSKRIKFFYATQVGTCPPRFVIFCSHPNDLHFSYKRFVENEFRKAFGFEHIPLGIHFKERERRESPVPEARARAARIKGLDDDIRLLSTEDLQSLDRKRIKRHESGTQPQG